MAENGNPMAWREACQKTIDLLMSRGNGKCRCVLSWDEFNDTQKMLRAALSAPTEQPMNSTALREALCDIVMLTMKVGLSIRGDVACGIIANKAKRALAAPARNCDVGTPDEQEERFDTECKRYDYCTSCPVHAAWGEFKEGKPKSCRFIWAQMPYMEGGQNDI
jgi:hypothetical protein